MIVSEYTDMIARQYTMPFAKAPIEWKSSSSDRFIVDSLQVSLLRDAERERLLHELFHLASTDFRGDELHLRQRVPDRLDEEVVRRLQDLEGARLGASRRVHDELREHFALDARLPEHVRIAR